MHAYVSPLLRCREHEVEKRTVSWLPKTLDTVDFVWAASKSWTPDEVLTVFIIIEAWATERLARAGNFWPLGSRLSVEPRVIGGNDVQKSVPGRRGEKRSSA